MDGYEPVLSFGEDTASVCDESHVEISAKGIRLSPIVTRYCTPGELDLMGRIAGLRLHDRWSDWQGEPFAGESHRHVSVWGR